MELQREYEEFWKTHWSGTESILHTVITGHLFIEKGINEFLSILFKNPQPITDFSFSQKLKIIESTSLLQAEGVLRLKAINALRNNYGHDLDYKLNWVDVEKLGIKTAGVTKEKWDADPQDCVRACMSYLIGSVHGGVILLQKAVDEKALKFS